MHTLDGTDVNIRKIAELFPNCLSEKIGEDGHLHQCIDFDVLRQELSKDIVEGAQERYQFTWPDKKKAIRLANAPTTMTLRPCREESVDFDNTENLYIEGDNLEVLKILRETYLGRVKMIYIDPPYNTGNDFVYEDDFSQTSAVYTGNSGQTDAFGNRLVQNTESNGRFHTDWLNMIYPRLKVAKDLLSTDGVIFISIDDNEQRNLKIICDEVFGPDNFVSLIPWRKRTAKSDVPFGVSQDYEWILIYARSREFIASIEGKERKYFTTPDFPDRPWRIHDLSKQTTASERPKSFFTIVNPKSGERYPANPNRTWAITEDTFERYYKENRIVFPGDYSFLSISKPAFRYWKEDDMQKAGDSFGRVAVSTKLPEEIGMSQDGTKEITDIFDGKIFSFPKPTSLIEFFLKIINDKQALILDFFSGSATTAHAIMKLNDEDGGNRKFIMVQLPEETDSNSEAFKAGFKNICEIGKERIRRAGNMIKEEISSECDSLSLQIERMAKAKPSSVAELFGPSEQKAMFEKALREDAQPFKEKLDELEEKLIRLDTGFRVLKLDSSNMEEVYYRPEDSSEATLFEDNVKPNRTGEDLLFQVMLECNLPLSAKIQTEKIAGKEVFSVNNGYLIACFDVDVNEEVITTVAKRKPYYFIMRDKSLSSDNVADNFEQIFQAYSKETIRRIL